jgi:hypothetical protein
MTVAQTVGEPLLVQHLAPRRADRRQRVDRERHAIDRDEAPLWASQPARAADGKGFS